MTQVHTSIKDLRKENNMTQDQLAERLHVTRQAVSNWENGKTQPDIETLTQLAQVFGVDVERLIYGRARPRWHFALNIYPERGLELGVMLAMIISYAKWQSIGWALFHGLLNWGYVLYYIIKY